MIEYTHKHNTRPFSKTHILKFTIEQADKKTKRLILVTHSHIQNSHPVVESQ